MDSIIQQNDDSDSARQLIEFLKKQLDGIDPEKRETPAQSKARKKKQSEASIDFSEE